LLSRIFHPPSLQALKAGKKSGLKIPILTELKNMREEELRDTEDLRTILGPILSDNRGRWFRFIMAILKNEEDAEDVLQEAVRRVLACERPLLSREQARMYLGRAIGNTALELYNIRKRERVKHLPVKENLLSASTCSPYASMERGEKAEEREFLLHILNKGMLVLPLKQREALRITILESFGLSIRDVGSVYGIPYSTLRHRSKQGLKHLRRFLERELRNRRQKTGVISQKRKN
jgi:RNA polymerase sigma-70 factor (ECF subfamily)